jgi:hypothetical protein
VNPRERWGWGIRGIIGALSCAVVVAAALTAFPAASATARTVTLPDYADVFLVSRTDDGASADAALTPDGQKVAYVSTANGLADNSDSDFANVFLATAVAGSGDPFSGRPLLVSRPDSSLPAEPADEASSDPAVSADGRFVAFVSRATNLVPGITTSGRASVYVRDTVRGASFRLDAGSEPDADSSEPDISDDGRYVVFASDATNLVPGDANSASDVFVADLDANGDGSRGDLSITRLAMPAGVTGGMSQPAISGNGQWVLSTAGDEPSVYRTDRAGAQTTLLFEGARQGAIDATGTVFAAIVDDCDGTPVVAAATIDDSQRVFAVVVGTTGRGRSVAELPPPVLSADGSTVAWSTTQPDPAADGSPDGPVVRVAQPSWADAEAASLDCTPATEAEAVELGVGEASGISASGRTVALSGPSDMSGADSSVTAVDLHTNDGLAVSNTIGTLAAPESVASANTADIPPTEVAGLGAALVGTPLSRLDVARLPLAHLPLSALPLDRLPALAGLTIAQVPLHRAGVPGGWSELLGSSDLGERLPQTVTLAEALASADETDASPLTIGDVNLAGTGIDTLSVASLLLADTPIDGIPLAGGTGTQAWQALVDARGLGTEIDAQTTLAELDAAGLDVGATGIDSVPLDALPIDTALTDGAPDAATLGELLVSLVDTASLPWERIDPESLPADAATTATGSSECATDEWCDQAVRYQFTFDPGPGGPTVFPAPTAAVQLPTGTKAEGVRSGGSGPVSAGAPDASHPGPVQVEGSLVRLPLADTPAGTVVSVTVGYSASRQPGSWTSTGTLTSGSLEARDRIDAGDPGDGGSADEVDSDSPTPLVAGEVRYGSIASGPGEPNDGGADEDWFSVAPPKTGERLVVSAHAPGQQLSLTLLAPERARTPLGVVVAASGSSATAGQVPVDASVSDPSGNASVEASAAVGEGAGLWAVRVASANGEASPERYALRAEYRPAAPEERCTPWSPPGGVDATPTPADPLDPLDPFGPTDPFAPTDPFGPIDPLSPYDPFGTPDPLGPDTFADPTIPDLAPSPITSDPVTSATNTVFVIDTARFRAINGFEASEDVTAAIRALDGTGSVGDGAVKGAILSVDTDPAVASARAALDAQPCSVSARTALAAAINSFVVEAIGDERGHIAAIVIVGGDDIIPFAPVPQGSGQVGDSGHATQLRFAEPLDGGTCPTDLEAGAVDPCATPLSAAASAGMILTDDPYALAEARPSSGGYLYVPTVAIGRLVDSADQIRGQLDRFRLNDGVLDGDSALSGAYGPSADLPQLVSENLAWRLGAGDTRVSEPWTAEDAEALLFPGDDAAPRIVVLSGTGDERRLQPGVEGAVDGEVDASEYLEADDHEPPRVPSADALFDPDAPVSPIDGSVVVITGDHAGINLPASYYGDTTDWADVFSAAGAFIANTGRAVADDVTTSHSERLAVLYTDWIGVTAAGGAVSSGDALLFAKQSYLGATGAAMADDDRTLMQSIYFGVPMYTFADSTKEPPVPAVASDESASTVALAPSLATVTRDDGSGNAVTYVTADGELPLVEAGGPLLPRVVTQIPSTDEDGGVPRGALITGLTSTWSGSIRPAVHGAAIPGDAGFPESFTAITRQLTPDGPVSMLVATPASVQVQPSGEGRIETFPTMELQVLYGSSADTTAPVIRSAGPRDAQFVMHADDDRGSVERALLLVQDASAPDSGTHGEWLPVELEAGAGDEWVAEIPSDLVDGGYRWIVQVADESGNVATDAAHGRIGGRRCRSPRTR